MSIFEYTFCKHSVKFVAIAAMKPYIWKLNSFTEHNAKPDITGIKLKFTNRPVCSPSKHRDNITVNNGAELFIVSVKLTAT